MGEHLIILSIALLAGLLIACVAVSFIARRMGERASVDILRRMGASEAEIAEIMRVVRQGPGKKE